MLELPAKHIEIVRLKFTLEEREVSVLIYLTSRNGFELDIQVYDMFEKQTKIQLNKFMRNGTLVKKYAFEFSFTIKIMFD